MSRMKRRSRLTCVVGLFLLEHPSSAFSPPILAAPHQKFPPTTATRLLLNAIDDSGSEESEGNNGINENIFSRVKQLGKKGGADVASAAKAAGSGIQFAAGATGSSIKSVAGSAKSGITQLAAKGGSDVKTMGKAAASGIQSVAGGVSQLAEQTSSGVQSVVGAAGSGVKAVAGAAGSGIKTVAITTTSGLGGLAQKGGSDVVTLAQWLNSQAKETASAAKDSTSVATRQAKAVARKLVEISTSVDYNLSDILLLLRVLLAIGASFGPLAKILPVTVLLQMLNVSLEARLGGKILDVLAGSLDERFMAAISAEELGDLAKRSITGAILAFTGKESYEAGDIERAVTNDYSLSSSEDNAAQKTLQLSVLPEFAQWDEVFRENHPDVELVIAESVETRRNDPNARPEPLDKEVVSELEEWDRIFRETHPETVL